MVLVRHFIRDHHHVCRCTLRTLSPLISLLGTPTNHTGMSQTRLLPPPRRRHAAMANESHRTSQIDQCPTVLKAAQKRDGEKTKKNETMSRLLGCRDVGYYWTHALITAPPTIHSSSVGTWWCATRSVLFKSDSRVYYTLSSSLSVRFSCVLPRMFYPWYVNGFDRSWPKRVHRFGRWWG